VLCPMLLHGLRWWMYRRQWIKLPLRGLILRLIPTVLALAVCLAGLVLLVEIPMFHMLSWQDWEVAGALSMVLGFTLALSGWLVIYFSAHAVRRRRLLERQALELQVLANNAHLEALQEQLNPHFLFNCLNDVRGLIAEDPERAQEMVTRLASLLRYSLKSAEEHTVSLDRELKSVQDYFALQKMRFEERLRVHMDVASAALPAHVPAMMFETLAENAVKHGISKLPTGGEVAIVVRCSGPNVVATVTNTGSLDGTLGGGIGLRNARERLRLLYGNAAQLSVEETNGTVTAKLVIPFVTGQEAAKPRHPHEGVDRR